MLIYIDLVLKTWYNTADGPIRGQRLFNDWEVISMWRVVGGSLIVASMLLGGCFNETAADDQATQFDFDRTTVGSLATGWVAAETNSQGTPAAWRIVKDGFAPSPPHVMAIVANQNSGQTYNLLMANSGSYRDLELHVFIRANSGKEDQGGGVFWRARDTQNYYLARWNPLEANFRVYVVKNGKRRELASTEARVDPSRWQRITIAHQDDRIEATLNDRITLTVVDKSFTDAGRVGLWTKADAASSFDEFTVQGLESGLEE